MTGLCKLHHIHYQCAFVWLFTCSKCH